MSRAMLGRLNAILNPWLGRLAGLPIAGLINLAMRMTRKQAGLAIVYHAIEEYPSGCERLVPAAPASLVRRELRHLRRHYNLVPVHSFHTSIANRTRGGRFPVCVTFDDDLAEHATTALPILRDEGIRATFFLCGMSLEGGRSFWWERLQRAVDAGVKLDHLAELLPSQRPGRLDGPVSIHRIAARARDLGPQQSKQFSDRLSPFAGSDPPDAGLSASDVREIVRHGHAIGFHTRDHLDLTKLSEGDLRAALTSGRAALDEVAGQAIDAIAFPYGLADARVAARARKSGYILGFTADRCLAQKTSDPLLAGRLVADSIKSLGEFTLIIAGTFLLGPGCPTGTGNSPSPATPHRG